MKLGWYGPSDPYEDYPDTYLYMVYDKKRRRVLYIGQAYDQSVRARILEHVRGVLWDWIRRSKSFHVADVGVKVGGIAHMGQQRISRELVADIESLLIITVDPLGNIRSTATYRGRDLHIENTGNFSPLPNRLTTENLE